jgi:ABC-type multidrug transport system permease subunit
LNEKPLISHLNTSPFMKWLLLTIGILAVVAIAILGTGIVGLGMAHYCMPPIGHITPMICRVPLPPGMPLKPMPIPHPNYH